MRPSLRRLLDHPIDYAGLFPPAHYDMPTSVAEYLAVLDSNDSWIMDKFICPASKLEDACREFKDGTDAVIRVSVIGSIDRENPLAAVQSDAAAILKAHETAVVDVEAYEFSVPQGESLAKHVAAVKRLPALVSDEGIDLYLEVGWGEGMVDAIHDAASLFDAAGFKARTGGTVAEAFPSCADLAAFISECSSLDCAFKFTAGLHEPIRYYDETLGTYRHGFLNALLAGALGATKDLNRREIEEVLMIDDPALFHFGVDDIRVGEHWLEAEQIEQFWSVFGGFGSCSYQEPLEGLRRLRLLEEVGA